MNSFLLNDIWGHIKGVIGVLFIVLAACIFVEFSRYIDSSIKGSIWKDFGYLASAVISIIIGCLFIKYSEWFD